MQNRTIKFSPPDITEREINAVAEVLHSGWITTGPRTKLFEQKLSEYCGTSRTVCLNSATAAIELTLRLLGIGAGDEVITTAYTYSASASVIQHVGAKIVLIDTAKDSYEMDYEQLRAAINANTKAIIAVDVGGVICDYAKIFAVVKAKKELFTAKNNLQRAFGRVIVIADAAHSFGSRRSCMRSGELADFTSFSFHAVKNLTTAEGGAVTWCDRDGLDNDVLYKEYQLLSLHGQSKDAFAKTKLGAWEYDIVYPAYKCNMTDIMAAIGLSQLERYQAIMEKRRQLVEQYNHELADCEIDILRHFDAQHCSCAHLYMVRLSGKNEIYRNCVIEELAALGIATNVHYKPLPMHTAYKNLGFDIINYPNAYDMYRNEITLPLHNLLTPEDVSYIVANLKAVLKRNLCT